MKINYKVAGGEVIRTIKSESNEVRESLGAVEKEGNKIRSGNKYKIPNLKFDKETNEFREISCRYEEIDLKILVKELKSQYLRLIEEAKLLGESEEIIGLQKEYKEEKEKLISSCNKPKAY